jgi:hypothetical protein
MKEPCSDGDEFSALGDQSCRVQRASDQFGGADTVVQNGSIIEGAASAKFDGEGADLTIGRRNGSPFPIVQWDDLPDLEHHRCIRRASNGEEKHNALLCDFR